MKTYSDEQLIYEFCQRKNIKAFDEIFERYMPDVYRYIYSRLGHVQATEDIVSETFMTLFECLHAFDGSSKLKTFIIGIAINKMRHTLRSQEKRFEVSLNEELFLEESDIDDYDEVKESDYVEQVHQVLDRLSATYKNVLERLYIQQQSVEQIATALGTTVNNVRVLHHRALKKAVEIANLSK